MEGIIGEIRIFAGNFAPKYWAYCMGQILSIASNTALFSILGTTYGGDGRTTFGLPDLRGRAGVGQGQSPGLSQYTLGEITGEPTHSLTDVETPSHNHTSGWAASANPPSATNPGSQYIGSGNRSVPMPQVFAAASSPLVQMSANATAIGVAGNGQPHNNMQPYLAINYIICTAGMFPPRN